MTPIVHSIWLPYEVPSQNKTMRRHWRANHKDVKLVQSLVRVHGWEICDAKQFRHLHITAYRKQRCTDIANVVGGAKSLVDGVVRAGALVDDSDKHCRISYDQRVLSELPGDIVAKFGKRAMTLLTFTEG